MKFPEQRPPDFKPPIGRKGRDTRKKGYVVVKSDRDPTKEVRSTLYIVVTVINSKIRVL